MPLNRELLKAAKAAVKTVKIAFVPPGGGAPPAGDPMAAAGGAPPMDPAMMAAAGGGGAPPMDPAMMAAAGGGGAPPMDPAMMGGAPPMDPAAMGGAAPPPPAPPADPATAAGGAGGGDIRSIIREEIQQAMGNGVGGPGGAKPKGKGKVDPEQLQQYMQRNQKLMTHLYSAIGVPLPYDILDEPSVDGEGGEDSKGGGSSSSGSGGGSSGGTDKKAENPTGIKPIQPIQPFGGAKTASVAEKAAAMLAIHRKLNL